jgi:hypothetical protein
MNATAVLTALCGAANAKLNARGIWAVGEAKDRGGDYSFVKTRIDVRRVVPAQ